MVNTEPAANSSVELTDLLSTWLHEAYADGQLAADQLPENKIQFLAKAIDRDELSKLSRVLTPEGYAAVPYACAYVLGCTPGSVVHRGQEIDLQRLEESLRSWDWEAGPSDLPAPAEPHQSAASAPAAPEGQTRAGMTTSPPPAPQTIGRVEPVYGPFSGQPVTAPRQSLMTQPVNDEALSARLLWPPRQAEDELVVYRLVAHDEFLPPTPDLGRTVLSTTESHCVIDLPTRSPLRFVQVWAYEASSLTEIGAATPEYVGDTVMVATPDDVQTQADYGSVNCTWVLPPDPTGGILEGVEIVRFPQDAPGGYFGLDGTTITGQRGIGGFVDSEAPAGDLVYRATVRVNLPLGGVATSVPFLVHARVPAKLYPVQDLAVEHDPDDHRRAQISWDTVADGKVQIYQSAEPPPPGHDRAAIPLEAMTQILANATQIKYPQEPTADGRTTMARVPVPEDWVGVYYTPVTVLHGQALIGQPLYFNNGSAAPQQFKIIERVSHQFLRFGWPAGVDAVAIHVAAPGAGEDVMNSPPTQVISSSAYRSEGGFRINLDWTGATVYATSLTQHGGRMQRGEWTKAEYPGVLPLQYSVKGGGGLRAFSKPTIAVSMWTDGGLVHGSPYYRRPVQFVCVFHPSRLPLHANDGQLVSLAQKDSGAEAQPVVTLQSIYNGPNGDVFEGVLPAKHGYVRVFLHMDPVTLEHFALIDPPVTSLRA